LDVQGHPTGIDIWTAAEESGHEQLIPLAEQGLISRAVGGSILNLATIGLEPPDELISAHSCSAPRIGIDLEYAEKFSRLQKVNGPRAAGDILPNEEDCRSMKTMIRNTSRGPPKSEPTLGFGGHRRGLSRS